MKEVWKNIDGFEESYQVSNLGRIRSLDRKVPGRWGTRSIAGKIMKPTSDGTGYLQVDLRLNRERFCRKVHILVAKAFIPGEFYGAEVNHIDGDKNNNHSINLEWVTPADNTRHALAIGLTHPDSIKRIGQYTLEGELVATYNYLWEAAENTGLVKTKICAVCRDRRKSHGGYVWKYLT